MSLPKKEMTDVEIIIPKGASTDIDSGLVELTRQLRLKTGESGGFGLGGQDGYGIEFENDTFMMRPYCWCEKDECKWCSGRAPNFWYKPTNCKINWYKYIGRSQEQRGNLPTDWLNKCVESVWDKDGCYYEFDVSPRNLSEGLMGRQESPKARLCFNVRDRNALVEAELSPFAEDSVSYWSLEEIIADFDNALMEDSEAGKMATKLDKKYPTLREKIKQDAIKRNEEKITWHKNRIKDLKGDK